MSRLPAALLLIVLMTAAPAAAQGWPDETLSLDGGKITLGGEITVTVSPEDAGHFNYTDYERSALQLIRVGVAAAWRPVNAFSVVADLRAEGDSGAASGAPFPRRCSFACIPGRTAHSTSRQDGFRPCSALPGAASTQPTTCSSAIHLPGNI